MVVNHQNGLKTIYKSWLGPAVLLATSLTFELLLIPLQDSKAILLY